MTTLISTCTTKKEFTARVREGINVTLHDPSGRHGRLLTLRDVQDSAGYVFTVTDKFRRWFAEVTVKPHRKLVVK
jgi:hypothetical protein